MCTGDVCACAHVCVCACVHVCVCTYVCVHVCVNVCCVHAYVLLTFCGVHARIYSIHMYVYMYLCLHMTVLYVAM